MHPQGAAQGAPATVVSTTRRQWILPATTVAIEPVVEEVQRLCRDAGCNARHCGFHIPVALTEALANAMTSGSARMPDAPVEVVLELRSDVVCIEVRDRGPGFDFDAVAHSPSDADWLEREDGRGIFLMRSLMDDVRSHCTAEGHTLVLMLRRT